MEKLGALLGKVWQLIVHRIDSYLMAAALAIAGVGMITLVSASDQSVGRLTSQALSLGFALVLMGRSPTSPQRRRVALPLYLVAVALLVAVAVGGTLVTACGGG
jgi:cell division protein FtsW (lipid II flippase)